MQNNIPTVSFDPEIANFCLEEIRVKIRKNPLLIDRNNY